MVDSNTENLLAMMACETYAQHGQLGHEKIKHPNCIILRDKAHPTVWFANRVYNVRASTAETITGVLRYADEAFTGYDYRHFVIDPATPSAFIARLAMDDYEEQDPVLQMVLTGEVVCQKPVGQSSMGQAAKVTFHPVDFTKDWDELYGLVRLDHLEGARTQGRNLDEEVTRGIVEGYQKKIGPCQFFLARTEGQTCAYGSGFYGGPNSSNNMGMVEDLFTLPEFRRRGVATALISHCVDHVRLQGAGPILIGGHLSDPPRHLYYRLGFEPVCLTRSMIKHL